MLAKGDWFEAQDEEFTEYEEDAAISLRDWQRRGKEFFFKSNGTAIFEASTGCLGGDTLIDMPRNNSIYPNGIKIKDLVGKDDLYTYTYNIKTQCLEIKRIINVWVAKKNVDVYKIITRSGRSIKATKNHPFLVSIKEKLLKGCGRGKQPKIMKQKYVYLKDLKQGMFLSMWPRSTFLCNGGYAQIK